MNGFLPRPARLLRAGALAAALAAAPAAARADQIDRVLIKESAAIAEKVAGLKARHIAVLPFQVQIGGQAPTFKAGVEGLQMANKLQNLLVLTNPADGPAEYVVLADAVPAAAAAGRQVGRPLDYTTPEGRQALLGLRLPVVWDADAAHAPDTFLTGLLKVSADLTEATVVLRTFSRADPELRTVMEVRESETVGIRVDRNTLADLGRSFAVAKAVKHPNTPQGRRRAVVGPDETASAAAAAGVAPAPAAAGAIAVPNCPVELTVLYNGRPAAAAADGSGNLKLAQTPSAGTLVTFNLRNTGDKAVAVVLTVDGVNTIGLNPDERADVNANRETYRKYVLQPNVPYTLKGRLTDAAAGKYQELRVDPEDVSAGRFAAMRPESRGKIELLVFPANDGFQVPAVTGGTDAPGTPAPPAGGGNTPDNVDPLPDDAGVQQDQATEAASMETMDKSISQLKSAKTARAAVAARTRTTVSVTPQGVPQVRTAPSPRSTALAGKFRGLVADGGAATTGAASDVKAFEHTVLPSASVVVTYYTPAMAGR